MVQYRGYDIQLSEAPSFDLQDKGYSVKGDGLVFLAESDAGKSFAVSPFAALEGAYKLIDQKCQKEY